MNIRQPKHRQPDAFTLIEVMISSALMAVILVSAYLCLGAGFSAQKLIEPRTEVVQNARVALALMTADLQNACPLSKDDDFLGMPRTAGDIEADNLDFGTHNYTPKRPREGDFCQESYYLDKDPETSQFSLWRRRNPTIALDPLEGGSKEEIAKGVLGLKLEYYDGTDWFDSWGQIKGAKDQNSNKDKSNLSGLPKAVRITLLLNSDPGKKSSGDADDASTAVPMVFKTVVCLNLADASQTAQSSSSSSNNGDASANPSSPNGGGN